MYRSVPVERRECGKHFTLLLISTLCYVNGLLKTSHKYVFLQIAANGRGAWRPYEELHKAEFLRKLKITKVQQSDRNLIEETKYLETALVMDYSIVSVTLEFSNFSFKNKCKKVM